MRFGYDDYEGLLFGLIRWTDTEWLKSMVLRYGPIWVQGRVIWQILDYNTDKCSLILWVDELVEGRQGHGNTLAL
ncbi:hypothetical protein KDW_61280 [Dictyobacter vulcani]|uniref:Uncharacterized protein n=1 Tax=Dictyobacter vulcani TaxID=2607529 RepID=A0A5J4L3C2_9CHLR|nr:hypothetical protein KDW_61280 [Dictyobacter vulcani]